MARFVGPTEIQRTIQGRDSGSGRYGLFADRFVEFYEDEALTDLADIRVYNPASPLDVGAAIPGSRLRTDRNGKLAKFWFPDNVNVLYAKVLRGPVITMEVGGGGSGGGGGVSPGDLAAAVNAAVPPAVAAAVTAAGVTGAGDTGTYALATTTLGNGETFYSPWFTAPGGFPAGEFASARLESTADATYTAVLQGSVNGVDTPYELQALTVTTANGISTVAQTVTNPPARHVRWAITATAAGMTKLSAKGITA